MKESVERMWTSRAGRWARATVVGVAALVAAAHILTTVVVNSPNNPVRQQIAPLASGYFDPVFSQNWQLFAPNPVNVDRGMLVQARLSSGTVTGYADVTSPVIARQLHDPFPDRSAREITRSAGNFLNAIAGARDELAAAHRPADAAALTHAQLALLSEATRTQYVGTRGAVVDAARWQARALWGPTVTAVQVKLLSYRYPRFSQRDRAAATGPGTVTQLQEPWWPATDEPVR